MLKIIRVICAWPSLISALIGSSIYYSVLDNKWNSVFIFVMVLFTTMFGFSLNNIIDRHKDLLSRARKVNLVDDSALLQKIKVLTLLFIVGSILISTFMPWSVFLINFIVLIILSGYSFINNKYGIFANILTSFCPFLLIWLYPFENGIKIEYLLLSIYVFFYVLCREFVMDHFDYEADKSVDKSSLAITFGKRRSLQISVILLTIVAVLLSVLVINLNLKFSLILTIYLSTMVSFLSLIPYSQNLDEKSFLNYFSWSSVAYVSIFFSILF